MSFITSGKVRKVRLSDGRGGSVTLSTGYRDVVDADDVEETLRGWEGRQGEKKAKPALIAALLAKRVALRDAYDAHVEGRLAELMARVATETLADAEAREREAEDPDLSPRVEEWRDWKRQQAKNRKKKRHQAAGGPKTSIADDYHRKVRVLYPLGAPLRPSMLTPTAIAARLDALTHQGPTKNRYRTAVSQFCKYLVRKGLLATNPVRDVEGFGENDERLVYYEIPDARRVIDGLEAPYQAVSAFALAFGAEWEAITSAMGPDLVIEGSGKSLRVEALVRGTKRSWRRRKVKLVKELYGLLPILREAFRRAGAGPVFPGVTKEKALRRQRAVATALGAHAKGEETFSQHDLHDWRHTHAVALLRWGYSEQIVASHLAHKNTDLVRTRYGVFIPTDSDYRKKYPVY